MKKNIAIIGGGDSPEAEVSIRSAAQLRGMMDLNLYNVYVVFIKGSYWAVQTEGQADILIDKSDFTFSVNGSKISFDCIYSTIHGTPGEDGKLQAYFELIGLPYTGCGVFTSALTFNKFACKMFLNEYGILSAKAVLIRRHQTYNTTEIIAKLGLPCFVKPNNSGSSFGVSKVKTAEELQPAIQKAFSEDAEVIIESFIQGIEVTNGIYCAAGKTTILPITEIASENEFFDYEAKYNGASREITPARLSQHDETSCKAITARVYELLDCRGVVRIDYILSNGKFYMLEINTAPGMSQASIIPQQIRAAGLQEKDVFSAIIEDAITFHRKK